MSERQKKDRKIDRAPGRQRQNDSHSGRVSGQLKITLLVLEKRVMAFYVK